MRKKLLIKILFIIGFLLCTYPIISNMIEEYYHRDIINTYSSNVVNINKHDLENKIEKATEYNKELYSVQNKMPYEAKKIKFNGVQEYNNILNIGSGVMGNIEIPKINVNLPIYHGTSEKVLSVGVGHIYGSSFPIGGTNTKSILTAHRGLPSSKLFTRLDELVEGDLFFIRVLDKTLAYRVCDIKVILPDDIESLKIEKNRDLVSLVTCTPYGINTHRLVVTGERVPFVQSEYDGIESKTMSLREIVFFSIPLVLVIGGAILKVKDKKKGD